MEILEARAAAQGVVARSSRQSLQTIWLPAGYSKSHSPSSVKPALRQTAFDAGWSTPPARQLHGQPVHAHRGRRERRRARLRARPGRDPDLPGESRVDGDGNGQLSPAEAAAERERLVAEIAPAPGAPGRRPAVPPWPWTPPSCSTSTARAGCRPPGSTCALRADDVALGRAPWPSTSATTTPPTARLARDRRRASEAGTAVLVDDAATVDRTDAPALLPAGPAAEPARPASRRRSRRASAPAASPSAACSTDGNVAAGDAGRGDDRFASLDRRRRRRRRRRRHRARAGDGLRHGPRADAGPRQGDGRRVPRRHPRHRPPRPRARRDRHDHAHRRRLRARPGDALALAVHRARDAVPVAQPGQRRDGAAPSACTPSATGCGAGSAAACGPRTWSTATATPTAHGHAHDSGHGTRTTPGTAATTTAPARRRGRPRPHPRRRPRPLPRGAGRPLVALADRARHLRRAHALPVGAGRAALGHRPAPGGLRMALILAFSFGLAVVVSGIGMTVLYARRLFPRLPVRPGPPRRPRCRSRAP